MPAHTRTHAQRLDELQAILRAEYNQDVSLDEASKIADWLTNFYVSLHKLAMQRRAAEHEAAELKTSLLDHSQK